MGKSQQLQGQRFPLLSVNAVFLWVQTMVWLPVFVIFNVHADVEACMPLHAGAVQTPQKCLHWKLTLGENSPATQVTQTQLLKVNVATL